VSEKNEYKSDPIDGDNDGIVQEGTPFERPVGEELSVEEVAEILEDLEADNQVAEELEPAPVLEEVAVEDSIISSPEAEPASDDSEASLSSANDDVISSSTARKPRKSKKVEEVVSTDSKPETVALYSTRNVHWIGVGKVTKGYNIVSKSQAEQWLTRPEHIRLVEPNEVSKELRK
jgi:uncharacterized membrane protein